MAATILLATTCASAGRFEEFTAKATQGEKLKTVAATYFGGPGIEEFVAAEGLPDGGIVAFGNAARKSSITLPMATASLWQGMMTAICGSAFGMVDLTGLEDAYGDDQHGRHQHRRVSCQSNRRQVGKIKQHDQ